MTLSSRIAVPALAAAALAGLAPTANADTPTVHGCTGNTIAYAAHTLAPFGQFVSPLARNGEIAVDVHTIQTGGFSDEDFPNSCN